jgi:3-hydroxyisobutyrate dehydrogenase-like beta-hydroxyacid dehydrogenase
MRRIALIGYGEVGRSLARDLRAKGIDDLVAFDVAFADPASRASRAAAEDRTPVAESTAAAVRDADLVFDAVTAGSALDAAGAIAAAIAAAIATTGPRGAFVVDMNSVAPATKVAAAERVEAAGGRYVEAAVMSPWPPKGLRTPLLLGGPHAAAFLGAAGALDLDAQVYADRIGPASSVKMCRSIMVKGVEAIAMECVTAADAYGVLDDVLASLKDLFPGIVWTDKAGYLTSRALIHGRRRAEEMREVCRTIEDAGFEPVMTRSTVVVQDRAADIGATLDRAKVEPGDLAAILAMLRDRRGRRD